MSNIENIRGIGDNTAIDHAQIVTDRLRLDYAETFDNVAKALAAGREKLGPVKSDEKAIELGAIIKNLRDFDKRLEAFREAEKQPYMRAEQAVDNVFFGERDKIAKRKKGDRSVKPGLADELQAEIDAWQNEKIEIGRAHV